MRCGSRGASRGGPSTNRRCRTWALSTESRTSNRHTRRAAYDRRNPSGPGDRLSRTSSSVSCPDDGGYAAIAADARLEHRLCPRVNRPAGSHRPTRWPLQRSAWRPGASTSTTTLLAPIASVQICTRRSWRAAPGHTLVTKLDRLTRSLPMPVRSPTYSHAARGQDQPRRIGARPS
ncbi:MAG: hypothetical protein QOF69_3541, partial [Solirubrobacteraceae bacterium]|nr:hypothetical protein [Solirubrobacteraceae bacterium]